jgi:ribosome recycling factor
MSLDSIIKDTEVKMEKSIASMEHDLSGLRTGRASINLLNPVVVEAYGSKMPISQVATVSVAEAMLITVQVWDIALVKTVEKAIANANLGVSPVSEGNMIRIAIPNLSEERRKELAKIAHKYGESAKIAVRNVRRDGIEEVKKLQKASSISEDEMHDTSYKVQKITDKFIKKIDDLVASKEAEIIQSK